MLRLRRYRVFVICAFVVLFLLYHVSRNSQWDSVQPNVYDKVERPHYTKPKTQDDVDADTPRPGGPPQRPPSGHHEQAADPVPPKKEQEIKIPQLKSTSEVKGGYGLPKVAPTTTSAATKAQNTDKAPVADTFPTIKLPDRVDESKDQDAPIRVWKPPKKVEDLNTAAAAIHWKKPKEWFPVPKESIIPLPTGSPKPMPSVQHKFKEESKPQKEKRETRLAKVRAEAMRAWSGYKQFAWTHDELTPVTKHGKDPFCGWAATLVDSLDTLWIMGLKDEFDEAVKAVKEIDFTTTPYRSDIPIFETIIRYLGGLVGAYDVTGGHDGKYRVLLDKALELAEILMSVFDTPNRMPVLYYNWQPEFNENPKRASTSVSVAEIGSMGMEFTRLAQLTGEDKYYDAIARITDALEELQNRKDGTALPGIFPQQLDASGCNRTAAAEATLQKQTKDVSADSEEPEGYASTRYGSTQSSRTKSTGAKDLEFEVKPGSRPSEPGSGRFHDVYKRELDSAVEERGDDATGATSGMQERDSLSERSPISAKGLPANWECVPQGLTSGSWGMDSYSMGGSQDSAYEYFPKQYALLGGLEPKYRTMHEKTVAAVKKYLLFRPMAKGDPDILFSAKASSSDNTDKNLHYEWEITHLTCFLGGMFGLGGKLFNSPEDVEIGKRLADGCVWAYEVMPTGIMPEFSMALPCQKVDDCQWNQTAWYEHLDPESAWRKTQLEEYNVKRAKWKEEVQKLKDEEERRLKVESAAKADKAAQKASQGAAEEAHHHHSRRDLSVDGDDEKLIEEKVEKLESELDLNSQGGYQTRNEDVQKPVGEIYYPVEPLKPLTHEEFVEERIKRERLVPGFASLNDRRYILRPEAIESVWYMYRITGDPIWQEKGWRMFESIIKATQTEVGHSAIDDVTTAEEAMPTDSMESFWLAETLKYFYLLFTTPDVISLDEWVFNTEAHPFRRPTAAT
ncbi:Glycosyl hydrolase family 47 domain containing protein [Rhypophila sp. PSN 637]